MHNKKILFLFFLFFTITLFAGEVNILPQDFKFYGDAYKESNNIGILTPDKNDQAGSFWYQKKIDLRYNFEYIFDIYLGKNTYKKVNLPPKENQNPMERYDDDGNDDGYIDIGADGIAFVLQGISNSIYGTEGMDIGAGSKLSPCFATEFDTYNNHGYYKNGDLSFPLDDLDKNGIPKNITIDHMAFLSPQYYSGMRHNAGSSPIEKLLNSKMVSIGDIEDNKYHHVKLKWDATNKIFNAYFDDMNTPKLTLNKDIVKEFLNGNPMAYFGFTASTGSFTNEQKIKNIKLIADIPDLDFGDAPNSFKTLLSNTANIPDGPSHIINKGIFLGQGITSDKDGKPSLLANKDEKDDGVIFPKINNENTLISNKINNLEILASQNGYISIWIDSNFNGIFDSFEMYSFNVKKGINTVPIKFKNTTKDGKTYFRIRYSTYSDDIKTPTGTSRDGEVEDYYINLLSENLIFKKTVKDFNNNHIAEENEIITYSLNIKNNSNFPLKNLLIKDDLSTINNSEGDTFFKNTNIEIKVNNIPYKNTSNNNIEVPLLKSKESILITIQGQLKSSYPTGTNPNEIIKNIATLNSSGTIYTSEADIPIMDEDLSKLSINKEIQDSNNNNIAEDGEILTYILNINNKSNLNINNLSIFDPLDKRFFDSKNILSTTLNGKNILSNINTGINLPTLNGNSSSQIIFTVKNIYPKDYKNQEKIFNYAYIKKDNTVIKSNVVSIPTYSIKDDDIKISLSVEDLGENGFIKKDTFIENGEKAKYTITVSNISNHIIKNILVKDNYSKMKFYKENTYKFIGKSQENLEKGILIPLLKPKESINFSFYSNFQYENTNSDIKIPNTASLSIENSISKFSNTVYLTTVNPKLTLVKTIRNNSKDFYPGDNIIYDIQLTNTSNFIAQDINIKDEISSIKAFDNWSWKKGVVKNISLSNEKNDLNLKNINLLGKTTLNYTVICHLKNSFNQKEVLNTAFAGKNYEVSSTAKLNVISEKIKIIKEALKNKGTIGDIIPYRITIENLNPNTNIENLSIIDKLPLNFKLSKNSVKIANKNVSYSTSGRNITFKNINLYGNDKVSLTYMTLVGTGATPGIYKNIAWVENNNRKVSSTVQSSVYIENDPLFSSTVIIGKVFNDINSNGYQDEANAKNLKLDTLTNKENYLKYKASINIGDIMGRESKLDSCKIFKIKRPIKNPYILSSFKITDKYKNFIIFNNDGSIIKNIKSHPNSFNLKCLRKIVKIKNKFFEIIEIKNIGINEEGIPGVRLATVEGTIIETDEFGRYHLDGIDNISERGKNFIIKVDKSSIPLGSKFTTENPRVKRLSKVMNKFNFGVHLPVLTSRKKIINEQIVLGKIFFTTDKYNIRKDQENNIKNIIENLSKQNGGIIYISGNTDSRASNNYNKILGLNRANSIKNILSKYINKNKIKNLHIINETSKGEHNELEI